MGDRAHDDPADRAGAGRDSVSEGREGHRLGDHDHAADSSLRALATALTIHTVFLVVEFLGALYADSLTLLAVSRNILLQGTPRGVEVLAVTGFLEGLPGVVEVHDVHVWTLSSTDYALSAHVVVEEAADSDAVLSRCRSELGRSFDIDHATIQVESESYSHVTDFDCYAGDDAD